MARKLIWTYVVVGILTLAFQIWVRTGVCAPGCTLSYGKAVVWAFIWPASWVAYLAGKI